MDSIEQIPADQKHARNFLRFWTAIYAVYVAFTLSILLERTIRIILWYSLYPLTGLSVLILEVLTPLVALYSIWKMWSLYQKQDYKKAYWVTTYPVAVAFVTTFIRAVIS